jgi:hypothetical protein
MLPLLRHFDDRFRLAGKETEHVSDISTLDILAATPEAVLNALHQADTSFLVTDPGANCCGSARLGFWACGNKPQTRGLNGTIAGAVIG